VEVLVGVVAVVIALVVDDAAGDRVMALVVPVVRVIALMVVVHVVGCGRVITGGHCGCQCIGDSGE